MYPRWAVTGMPIVFLLALVASAGALRAQGQGPSAVRYTEAVTHPVRGEIRLPGTVESRTTSVVAAEASALVIAMEVEEGEVVPKNAPLARLRTIGYEIQLRAAEGNLEEARARLELAESKLARARSLFNDNVVSQDDLDDAVSERAAWQGRVDASAAEIDALKLALNRCTVRAPFAGVVTSKSTDVGQWMDIGGAVVEMVAVDQLDVRVQVPEGYYRDIGSTLTATVTFESLPGVEVRGPLQAVIPRADAQSRTFPVKIRIPNPGRVIGVGMLARVAMPAGEPRTELLVPKDAIVRQGPQESVYRINGESMVEPVEVTSGQGVGDWVVVRGPLAAGDRVVTRGNERLFPGIPVSGEPLEYPLP